MLYTSFHEKRNLETPLQTVESLKYHPYYIRPKNILQHMPAPIPTWESNPIHILVLRNFTHEELKSATCEAVYNEYNMILD